MIMIHHKHCIDDYWILPIIINDHKHDRLIDFFPLVAVLLLFVKDYYDGDNDSNVEECCRCRCFPINLMYIFVDSNLKI